MRCPAPLPLFGPALLSLMTALIAAPDAFAAESVAILPAEISLTGANARQQLVVEQVRDGRFVGQISDGITLSSSDPKIVAIKDGVAIPVGNGSATITAVGSLGSGAAKVTVAGLGQPAEWSFRNHVQSVLSKGGCNSGACHGALAGKKGFRLSLRGYDAEGDYNVLTHQALGRRVNLADPGRSLLLTKPTTAITHGGGERFQVGSPEYNVIADWIASGAPAPKADDAQIVRLELLPPSAILKPKSNQQLLALAHFSDGRTEDVTRWAKYTATNGEVAQVDDFGKVAIMGQGEGAITAWYLNKIVVATVTVPYEEKVPADVFAKAPRRNFIDDLVLAKLQSLNIPPSPACGDSEFIRRAFLDTIGALPTRGETEAFLADKSADKRDKLIDALLERPEFVDYWTYKWSDLLLVNSEKLKPPAMWAYYNWIRNEVAANTPWDEFVRRLLTAQGSTLENGATNLFVLHQDPRELIENTSVAFLGMSIGCARCHNHPLEKWTNDEYFGMTNLVARVRLKDAPGDGNFTVFSSTEGDLIQPLTGKPQMPKPLDGEPIPFEATADRRIHLAKWMTSPENPYFSRAIANRIWANFMSVGLVEKIDDLRFTNPASNPELLAALSESLAKNGFDTKSLMRTILQSQTYQRSSVPTGHNGADRRFYSRYYPRRLMAEAMIDGISQVTGVPTSFPNYPNTWRAMQLPDSNVASYFLQKFGRPDRVNTCDCERTNEPNMVQILHIANGDAINKKLQTKGSRIDKLLAEKSPNDAIVDDLYLSALSRRPSETEKKQLLEALSGADEAERRLMLEDLYWSVLSSKEFLFNH